MKDGYFGFQKLILVFCQTFAWYHYDFFLQQVFVKIAILESIFMDGHGYPLGILTSNVTQLSLLLEKPNITSGHLCPREINVFKNSLKIIFM